MILAFNGFSGADATQISKNPEHDAVIFTPLGLGFLGSAPIPYMKNPEQDAAIFKSLDQEKTNSYSTFFARQIELKNFHYISVVRTMPQDIVS